jgi:SAM-dependent methyltransferase
LIWGQYKTYSRYYDLLNKSKNYEGEVNFLDGIFRQRGMKTILDVGCGTASHLIPLKKKGYDVEGVDASEEMRKIAEGKLRQENLEAVIHPRDFLELDLGKKFDAVIMMWFFLNHFPTEAQISAVLKNASKHTKKGGLCVIDAGIFSIDKDKVFYDVQHAATEGGLSVKAVAKNVCSARDQTRMITYGYLVDDNGKKSEFRDEEPVCHKAIQLDQLKNWLESAGLHFLFARNFHNPDENFDEARHRRALVFAEKI